nr:hypothetical protein [Bacteroidota bacterium]
MNSIGTKYVILYLIINICQLIFPAYAQSGLEEKRGNRLDLSSLGAANLLLPDSLPLDQGILVNGEDSLSMLKNGYEQFKGDSSITDSNFNRAYRQIADTLKNAALSYSQKDSSLNHILKPLERLEPLKAIGPDRDIQSKEDIKEIDIDKVVDSNALKIKELKFLVDQEPLGTAKNMMPEKDVGALQDINLNEVKKKIPAIAM